MRYFFSSFLRNIVKIFSGKNLLWHASAIFITYMIVITDVDWKYFLATRNQTLIHLSWPAVILGFFVPAILPFIFLIYGSLRRNKKLSLTGWAVGQAAILGLLLSGIYKSLTGRIPPPASIAVNTSHLFQFGFLRDGVFWGWPSSHTTVAFAVAVTLVFLYRKNKLAVIASLMTALYIGIGVSVTVHWFSEFIAGMIIGIVIGIVVGQSFKPLVRSS